MPDRARIVDEALQATERLRKGLAKGSSAQVSSSAERSVIKATAFAWFKNHRPNLESERGDVLDAVDKEFKSLLELSERHTTRQRYKLLLKELKADLIRLRSGVVVASKSGGSESSESPPEFAKLIPDSAMQSILLRRWNETSACLSAEAFLAATVMMGALLEALLLARINAMTDKSSVFRSKTSPKDKNTGKALPLGEWTLRHYIDVAHELGWIRQSAKEVSIVLRDYRNFIHPAKELSHNVVIDGADASMFWKVFSSLAEQVIASVPK
jgi:hypothetical protein